MPTFRLNALSRATRLWVASLGTAVLLPLSGQALAATESATAAQAPMETVLKGHFINLQALTANPMLRSTVEVGTDQLMQETGMRIRKLVPQQDDTFKDLKVMTGQLEGRARSLAPPGEMALAARPDGSFVALLPDANAIIRGNANGEQSMIRLDASNAFHPDRIDSEESDGSEMPGQQESRSGQRSFQVNRNAQGETVIDLLAGFSQKAVDWIGDHEAYALLQVATVNRAFKQSQIQGIRLRLVGTQVIPGDYPITAGSGGTLGRVSTLFAEGMRQYSPDVVAAFVKGIPELDTAAGWGNVNGRYSVNAINSPTAFRHELGHNIGGQHCSDGSSYRFGYHNGRIGSILCGNHVGYYSNPDIKDNTGVPLGDADRANMARVWRENAARMSAYSPSVMPLEDEQPLSLLNQKVNLSKNNTFYYPIDVPAGSQRLVFTVVDGERTEKSGEVQLRLKYGTNPTSSNYDYQSVRNYNTSLGVNNPQAGRWYLSISTSSRATQDQVLEGYAYAITEDTTQNRYLKLVATSSVDGKDNASVAELLLVDAKGKALPRDSWSVLSTSSAVAGFSAGLHAIDGNPDSYWSSAPGARYPHEIVIDLGTDSRFSQLHYLPRQGIGQSGNIKGYQVYGSDSPSGSWTLLADGEFSADNQVKAATLKPLDTAKLPVAQISGKSEANAGDRIVLDASASSDPQGHALSYAWQASPKLDFDFDGARISFTAPELQEDTRYAFTLTLSNGKQSSSRTHEVLVKAKVASGGEKPAEPPVQEVKPPVAVIGGTTEAKPGETVFLNATASTDPAGLQLNYSWKITPSVGFEAAGSLMKFVAPKIDQDAIYKVSLTVHNGKHSATREHQVKVLAEKPPVQEVKPPVAIIGGATEAKPGETVFLDATASTDPAGLQLDYSWKITPSVGFQAAGSLMKFVAPKIDQDVTYKVFLTVHNGKHSATREHQVKVLAEKPPVQEVKPPVAIIGGATEAKPGETVFLDATASTDPAGLQLDYSWKITPSVGFQAAGSLMKFVAPKIDQDVTYKVFLTVHNGKHSATREHQVKVLAEKPAVVLPPLASIAGATQAKGGESVTLDAAGSSDPAGLALSYKWSVTPNVAFQASGAKLTFVAPKSDKNVSYRFSLSLGNGSHTVSRDHSVTVLADKVQTPAGCQGAWSPQGTYVANDKVSHKGRFYVARWWTRNNEPGTSAFTGADGSGKVWRDAGACN